jgi:membrane protease YdiL (CAAX protease family)
VVRENTRRSRVGEADGEHKTINQDKRKPTDHRLFWLLLLAIGGCVIFQSGYTKAFPAASLNLNTSREEIQHAALYWARGIGFLKQNTIDSTTFTELSDQKAFLEQQLGQEEANRIMSSEVPTWLWCSRFCQEYDSDQCRVWLTPDKQLVRLMRDVRNDLELTSVSRDRARIIARAFVEQIVGWSLDSYSLIRDESRSLIKRTDHDFVWEDRGHEYRGARLRVEVRLSGDHITSVAKYLHLPEEWQGQYAAMRSYNMLLYNTAMIFWIALLLFGLSVFVWATAHHQIRWKVTIGAAALFSLVTLAQDLNNIPGAIAAYPTQVEFNAYLTQYWVNSFNRAGAWFAAALILAGVCEFLYRTWYPKRLAIENWLKPAGLASAETRNGLIAGHLLAAIYLGWVISYYLIGQHLDFWTPLQVESPTVLSSSIPAVSAVYLGVFASAHEELVFRVLGLGGFAWLLKRIPKLSSRSMLVFWLANLLQAAAWGFMHSTYPQQPPYARGLELTFAGMLFGWVFQAFGLLPCLVGHYLIDAFLTARPLLTSAQPALSITAALAVLPFVGLSLASLIIQRRRSLSQRSNAQESISLSNEALTMPPLQPAHKDSEPESDFLYVGHSVKSRWLASALLFVALALALWFRSYPAVGEPARLRINRDQAVIIARQVLAGRNISDKGLNVSAKFIATWTGPQSQYVFEHMPLLPAIRILDRVRFTYFWRVRFFRPNRQLEYAVELDGHGRENNLAIIAAENEPGATLKESQARRLVDSYIATTHPEVLPIEFANVSEYRRDHRTDYNFNFISPTLTVADAPYKVSCGVVGNVVTGFEQLWQVPDQWKEARDRKIFIHHLSFLCKTACQDLFILFGAWWAVGILRTGAVRWRLPLILGAFMALLALAGQINNLPTFFSDYVTSTPVNNYVLQQSYSWLTLAVNSMAEFALTSAFALVVWKIISPRTDFVSLLRITFRPAGAAERDSQKQLWIDAVVFAYAVGIVRWMIDSLAYFVGIEISPNVPDASLPLITSMLNTLMPGFDTGMEFVIRALRELLYAAVFAGLYMKYARRFPVFVVLVIVSALLFCMDMKYFAIPDYVIAVIRTVLESLLMWLFIAKLAKRNVLAYLLSGVVLVVSSRLPAALEHAPRVLIADIVVCLALLLLPVVYCLWLVLKQNKESLP